MEDIDILTSKVLNWAFEVHTQLGAGLLESTYEACLFYELTRHNIAVERQKKLPIYYKDALLDDGYRIEFINRTEANNRVKKRRTTTACTLCPNSHLYETKQN